MKPVCRILALKKQKKKTQKGMACVGAAYFIEFIDLRAASSQSQGRSCPFGPLGLAFFIVPIIPYRNQSKWLHCFKQITSLGGLLAKGGYESSLL